MVIDNSIGTTEAGRDLIAAGREAFTNMPLVLVGLDGAKPSVSSDPMATFIARTVAPEVLVARVERLIEVDREAMPAPSTCAIEDMPWYPALHPEKFATDAKAAAFDKLAAGLAILKEREKASRPTLGGRAAKAPELRA